MRLFKRSDLLLLFVLVAGALILHFAFGSLCKKKAAYAEIYYRSKLVKTIDLTEAVDLRFSVDENRQVIFHLYSDGSICFEQSDCRDKICVRTGRLYHAGETAACLPNGLVLKVVGENKTDADLIIG